MTTPFRAADIARHFLPQRVHYWYTRCKLPLDTLYVQVAQALSGRAAPLLDLGCGIGLLAQTLRAQGFAAPYLGVDNDASKVESARAAATRAGLADVRFMTLDLSRTALPEHEGSIAMLDVLQFMPEDDGRRLLASVVARVGADARLVIRSCLAREGARTRLTAAVDRGSRRIGWMNASPHWYPSRTDLDALFVQHGLVAQFTPPTGPMPFNNWLIVAQRR